MSDATFFERIIYSSQRSWLQPVKVRENLVEDTYMAKAHPEGVLCRKGTSPGAPRVAGE